VIRYSDHVVGEGARFFALACRSGLEGIVSKRRDQPYLPGRGHAWLKIKCVQRQELVIGGFTEPEGSRVGLGALLVGYHDAGRLVYAGKVGTGYTQRMLVDLRARLDPLVQPASPFEPEPPRAWTGRHRRWVEPVLVAEIAFGEWTADGRLRHPSFQGLRLDKRPADVVRERPAGAALSDGAGSPGPRSDAPRSRRASHAGTVGAPRPRARSRSGGRSARPRRRASSPAAGGTRSR
jgi:bifunctional non-homologous end joining protein LigD